VPIWKRHHRQVEKLLPHPAKALMENLHALSPQLLNHRARPRRAAGTGGMLK
jgi:hypothetical protein